MVIRLSLPRPRILLPLSVLCLWNCAWGPSPTSADESFYLEQVKPLLVEKCSSCHGPLKQEAGLRLDAATLVREGSENGSILAKQGDQPSVLMERVTADESLRMPPEGEGERLKPEQVAILQRWIDEGAIGPEHEDIASGPDSHWAYQPIVRPDLPANETTTSSNPIDLFIANCYAKRGLTPAGPTDKANLLRRVMLDLVGLPPTPEQIHEFTTSTDPSAYANLVDELLQSPRYGERWGRHWMDVWRYSDWDGYKNELRGSQRHIWHWRDWIIESLNEDKGYDQMLVEMLAGDEIAPEDPDVYRATGYLARNYHKSNRNIWLDATVEHTAKAFLGMTLNCSRCHDHKFDPIPQTDYYAFRAIFEPHHVRTERLPGQADLMKAGIPRAFDADPNAETYLYIRGNEKHPDKENPLHAQTVSFLEVPFELDPVELPPVGYFPSLSDYIEREDLAAAEQQLAKAGEALEKLAGGQPSIDVTSMNNGRPPSPSKPVRIPLEVEVAEKRVRVAQLRVQSLKARWAADRAKAQGTGPHEFEKLADLATQKERAFTLLSAELTVLEKFQAYEQALTSQEQDAKKKQKAIDDAEKALAKSRDDLKKLAAEWNKPEKTYTSVGKFYPQTSTGRRLALAKWIVHPENPLTARVAVNHLWMRHFGEPLVSNVFDFGLRSPRPIHAELLDWLAAELRENGWSMKHLHRLIVTSETYQLSSEPDEAVAQKNAEIDPDNHFLWKANVRRLEAEIVRDSLLHSAGLLDFQMGGPDLPYEDGEKVYRRSVYFRHAYEKQMQLMVLFDAASPNECYRRSPSIIPQQALALANSELSLKAASAIVERIQEQLGQDAADQEFINRAFVRILGRSPVQEERTACVEFLQGQSGNSHARRTLIHALLNHNDFVTVR